MQKKVWLITGCSTGLGKSIANAAITAGYSVVVAAKNTKLLSEYEALDPSSVLVVAIDVTKRESIATAVARAIGKFGRIDVLVNNAGYGYYQLLEEVSMAEFRVEMDVNLFGAVRMCRAVLPHMRKQRSGHIINMSSPQRSAPPEELPIALQSSP